MSDHNINLVKTARNLFNWPRERTVLICKYIVEFDLQTFYVYYILGRCSCRTEPSLAIFRKRPSRTTCYYYK